MADIIFFEQDGNEDNKQQRAILEALGHRVVPINILDYPWEEDELLRYFNMKPVFNWINQSAEKITKGCLNIYNLTVSSAIENMLKDHTLINFPLIKINDKYLSGFETDELEEVLKVRFITPLSNKMKNNSAQPIVTTQSHAG